MSGVIKCGSSHLMTSLLRWRNNSPEAGPSRSKRFAVGVGLAALSTTATIETVAYGSLSALATISPLTQPFCHYFKKLTESSAFTILWASADFLYFNNAEPNLESREPYARQQVQALKIPYITFLREEDANCIRQDGFEMLRAVMPQILRAMEGAEEDLPPPPPSSEVIERGAAFLMHEIYSTLNAEQKGLFYDQDSTIGQWVMVKAVYLYTFGAHREDEIPSYFQNPAAIHDLRDLRILPEVVTELERIMSNAENWDKHVAECAQLAFNHLREIAHEQRNGVLMLHSWRRAIEQLPDPNIS